MSIYDLLCPPAGWQVDAAVVCTYSASLDTVLSLPGAMLANTPGLGRQSPGRFTSVELAALKRICDRTLIFCQRGAVHPAELLPPAVIEVEPMVHEVEVEGGGAFHPKLWVVRFRDGSGEKQTIRLCVSSRNLTGDASWDIGIAVDGRIDDGFPERNDLGDLLRELPKLCARALLPTQRQCLATLAEDVERTRWTSPAGTRGLSLRALGLHGSTPWHPPRSDRLVVLSPFVDKTALNALACSTDEPVIVVSRRDALDRTWSVAATKFGRQAVLAPPPDSASGTAELHAKAYIWEKGRRRYATLGSMNATRPAMDGSNVEFLATVDCTAMLGEAGIDGLLGNNGLGLVIADYDPPEARERSEVLFDDRLVKKALWVSGLYLSCAAVEDRWEVSLCVDGEMDTDLPVKLPGLRFRPATFGRAQMTSCFPSLLEGEVAFPGHMELPEITGFTVFEADGPDGLISFTLNLEVRGVSEDARREAALRSFLPTEQSFLDFVRILLGDFSALETEDGAGDNDSAGEYTAPPRQGVGPGLLELLVHCATDEPERLRDIATTLASLRSGDLADVIPEDFDELWQAAMSVGAVS